MVWECNFPFYLTAYLYRALASLHLAVNQGAWCFSHLFGLCEVRLVDYKMTPAFTASSSKNPSMAVERCSFALACSVIFFSNASLNSSVEVCYFHFTALVPYSLRQSPSFQRYMVALCACSLVGVSASVVKCVGVGYFWSWFPPVADIGSVTDNRS
jgi:hypothetical protein